MGSKNKLLQFTLLLACSIGWTSMEAQDIHFTQYYMAPLSMNPAQTGAFEGTFRVGGIYRDQWGAVIDQPFQTPAFYVDAPLIKGLGKKDWIGGGFSILNDQAGSGRLTNLTAMMSLSYHLAIGKKANNYFSVGFQGGIVQRRVNLAELRWPAQFVDGSFNPNLDDSEDFQETNVSYPDFQVGALFRSVVNKSVDFDLGFAVHHIGEPDDAFLVSENLPKRYVGHAQLNIDITKKISLSPAAFYQYQNISVLNFLLTLGYTIDREKNIKLNVGSGYRYNDTPFVTLGMDMRGLKVGLAYDLHDFGGSTAKLRRGGFEVAVMYTAKIFKTPIVKPILFCPRF